MAMGPKNQVEKTETSTFDRIRYTAKKAVEVYFNKPLYYLFYGMLIVTAIVLLFDTKLPWQYYVLLLILASIQAYDWMVAKKK